MRAKLPLFLSLFLGAVATFFVWFYQNHNVQNYARGIVKEPEETLLVDNGRTNIALLGVGGEGHEGGELTDSILVASIKHDTKKVTLVSVPRDIWLEPLKSKVNAIYYYGEQASPGSGLARTKEALTMTIGIPIHYSLLVDFSGFIKAIDAVGGITVAVDRTFDDYKYPIPGMENAEPESARYEHLHFDQGTQRMDGVTALKYVRSRHALGDEGTDFARSVRQQKVIRAFLSSLISTKTVFNSERIDALKNTLSSSLKTDIQGDAISAFTKLSLGVDFNALNSISIESILQNPRNLNPYGGAWVLIPKISWEDVHAYVAQNLN